MASIPNISQGMSQDQVFDIINQLIDAFNASEGAISESLTDGKIDYNRLINIPRINGVVVMADMTQADLKIDIGASAQLQIELMQSRMSDVEAGASSQQQEINTLNGFKTTYGGYVDTLRSQRITDRADVDALQTLRVQDSGRIDLLDERYSAVHTTQTAEQVRVTEISDRVTHSISRLNEVTDAVVLLENQGCTAGKVPLHYYSDREGRCLQPIQTAFVNED